MGNNNTTIIAVLLVIAVIASITGTALVLDAVANQNVVYTAPPATGTIKATIISPPSVSETTGTIGITVEEPSI
jgi:hypothetical protein